jgi:phage/plasmid-associated DNA primase
MSVEIVERFDNLLPFQYLVSLPYNEMKKYFKKEKNEAERKVLFDMIKKYCKEVIRSKGQVTRIYHHSLQSPFGLGGRLFGVTSIQSCPKVIRGFLMKHTTDIDMKNAHPTILLWLCKKHAVKKYAELEYYINHRDEILGKFADREKGKELYLKALNKNKPVKEIPEFSKEIIEIQKQLINLPEYTDLKATSHYKEYNKEGSALNKILCFWENRILQVAIQAIKEIEIEIASMMLDGTMVYGNYYEDEELLRYLKQKVDAEFDGLNMIWDYKSHNNDIVIPDGWTVPEKRQINTDLEAVHTEKEGAEKIYQLYPHWVYCQGALYVFDDEIGIWDTDNTTHLKIVAKFEKKIRVYVSERNEDGDIERVPCRIDSWGNDLYKAKRVIEYVKTLCGNNNWLKEKENSSLGYLLFNNGYLNMKEGLFHSKEEEGFNPEIVFFGKIYQDWLSFTEEQMEYIYDIRDRLFYKTLNQETGDYLLNNLSRGLAGDLMKRTIFGIGASNTGKGVLTTALSLALGDYFGSFNGKNLAYTNSSSDEASKLRWLMLLRFKRIIISNEMSSKCVIDGNLLNIVSSGGDEITGRGHGGNETQFVSHFLTIGLSNDMPKIKPINEGVKTRLRYINYTKHFVEGEPTNEFELTGDPNIKAEIKLPLFQRCLVGLLVNTYMDWNDAGRQEYEPDDVKNATATWNGTEADIMQSFLEEFEITSTETDYVRSDEIEQWLQEFNITITKFSIEFKKYLTIHKIENVYNKQKKIAGKPKMVWVGLRRIQETEEEVSVPVKYED